LGAISLQWGWRWVSKAFWWKRKLYRVTTRKRMVYWNWWNFKWNFRNQLYI